MNDFDKLYTQPVNLRRKKIERYLKDPRLRFNIFQAPADTIGDSLIENFFSFFSLPMGLVPNIEINSKVHNLVLAVEETSIIAALNKAAKKFRLSGSKVEFEYFESYIIGQICYNKFELGDFDVLSFKDEIFDVLRSKFKNYYKRSQDQDISIEKRLLDDFVVYHVRIESHDSMGANLVTQFCEIISDYVYEKFGFPKPLMNIVSNSLDSPSIVAEVSLDVSTKLRDRVILASRFAEQDSYRASTHNKGILNAIDPIIIVSGNDWRANNAAIHSWCSRNGKYVPLAKWRVGENNELVGRIELPLQLGTVGGAVKVHPQVEACYALMNVSSKRELQSIIAVAGLLQNFAALSSLVTDGIVKGHMNLHISNIVKSFNLKEISIENKLKMRLEDQLRKNKKVTQSDAQSILNEIQD